MHTHWYVRMYTHTHLYVALLSSMLVNSFQIVRYLVLIILSMFAYLLCLNLSPILRTSSAHPFFALPPITTFLCCQVHRLWCLLVSPIFLHCSSSLGSDIHILEGEGKEAKIEMEGTMEINLINAFELLYL